MFKRITIGFTIVGSLTAILMLVMGTSVATFVMQRNNVAEIIFTELAMINNASQIILFDIIDTARQRTIGFSSDGFIRDATRKIIETGDQKTVAELEKHLKDNKLTLDASIYGINILDQSDIVVASSDPREIGQSGKRYAKELQSEDFTYGEAHVSDFMLVDNFGEHTIALTIAAPLTDKITGKRIGTMVNFIKAEYIAQALKTRSKLLTEDAERYASINVLLINKDGYIIDKQYFDGNRLTRQADIATILQCSKENRRYKNAQGVEVISAALCTQNGWTLATEVPYGQAMQSTENMRKNLIYLAMMLAALILYITYIVNKRVIRPIKTLAFAANKLGEGNFDVRTNIAAANELGDLSIAFNDTAKKLSDSHQLLAQKIREVTENFKKFKLAVDGASDHVVITDAEGIILYANAAAEKTTGYGRKELMGNRPSLWGKQMPKEFYRRLWQEIKGQRKSFYGEITNRRKDGQLYIAEAHISPLFDEQENLYGFVGIERDITRQKEVDRAKTEFVSIASHQLRTPLTIINWYIEMLSDPHDATLSEKQKRYLFEIIRANKRMIELINALLNVSRIDMGTFMVDVHPTDFALAMEDVLRDLLRQIAQKKLRIDRQYDRSLQPIDADPKLLRIIFQNLLTNAIKYTPNEGLITIKLSKKGINALIVVADTGYGIPAYQQEKIFSKFFRADNAREKEPDGNGLGLYIVKSLVEHSGGKIWFTSEENKGSTFYVEIPLAGMRAKEGTKPLAA